MPVKQVLMQQAFVYALDPSPAQERAFHSHAGGARFAYNWGLTRIAEALDAYRAEKAAGTAKPATKIPGHFELCKAWTAWKSSSEWTDRHTGETTHGVPWVGSNFVGTYQAALRDAAVAWKRFFDSKQGKIASRKVGRPRYKSKHRSQAKFQVHGETLRVDDAKHIVLPKTGRLHTHESTRKLGRLVRRGEVPCPPCDGQGTVPAVDGSAKACSSCKSAGRVPAARIVRGTVSQDAGGRWSIALTVERVREVRTGPSARQRAGGTIGVDWGVRELATLSTGETIDNPRHLEAGLGRLQRAQRHLSRCEKGSRRRAKAQRRVGRIHTRVRNLRQNGIAKATSHLVHHHDLIAVEGWDVQAVAQQGSAALPSKTRRNRNRALADTGIGMARWQLASKAPWYGATVLVTGKHETTGRTCSACGTATAKPLPPTHQEFSCPDCGHLADRRLNTARALATWAATHHNDAPSGGESKNDRRAAVRPSGPSVRAAGGDDAISPHPDYRDQTGTPGTQDPGVPAQRANTRAARGTPAQ
ncbi:RNA-guided endonuclease InsQ/TnpB family protein [Streptomyces xiamenensis]|uniref:RNA-guided endonuclease InsQ/TnpB family protein n=1 Tax=Streptomyces xiamenensis TaxID=408015 RepID=UPI0035E26F23